MFQFLDYLQKLEILKNCLLCTSYDLKYRFHGDSDKNLWEENMLVIHNSFPDLRIHTEMIATGFFMQAVIDGTFDIANFCKKFHTTIDYIEPGSGFYYYDKAACAKDMPDFFPTKDQAIKFIKKAILTNKVIDPNTFLSSSTHYYSFSIINVINFIRAYLRR